MKSQKKLGLNQREAREFVNLFFEEIRCALEAHEDVKLSGFGNYRVHHKDSREGRNPKTGEPAKISERHVVTFKASHKLREAGARRRIIATGMRNDVISTNGRSEIRPRVAASSNS